MFFLSAVIILDFSEFVHSLFVEKTLTIVREYPYLLLVGTLHREKILHSRFWQNRSWLHRAAQPLYHDWKRNPLKAPQTLQCPQIGRNRHRISKTLTKLFTLVILIQAIIEMVEQLTEYALMLSCTRLPSTFLAMKILLLCSITPSTILKEIESVLPFISLIVGYSLSSLPPFTSAAGLFFGIWFRAIFPASINKAILNSHIVTHSFTIWHWVRGNTPKTPFALPNAQRLKLRNSKMDLRSAGKIKSSVPLF